MIKLIPKPINYMRNKRMQMSMFSSPVSDFSMGGHDLSTIMKFNDISSEVQSHLRLVYSALAACFLCAVGGVWLGIIFHVPPFLSVILSLPLLCYIHADQDKENITKRMGMLCLFGALQGMCIGPLIKLAVIIDPTIIITALLCTVVIFVSFTLAAVVATRRSYLYLGGFLSSALCMLCIMSFVGMFVPAMRMMWLQLYGGLLIFSAFIIYDTQIIIEKASNGCRDFAGHALTLFLDFFQVFVRILLILLRKGRNGGSNNSGGSLLPSSRGDL